MTVVQNCSFHHIQRFACNWKMGWVRIHQTYMIQLSQSLAANSDVIHHFLYSNCAKDSVAVDIETRAVTRYNRP